MSVKQAGWPEPEASCSANVPQLGPFPYPSFPAPNPLPPKPPPLLPAGICICKIAFPKNLMKEPHAPWEQPLMTPACTKLAMWRCSDGHILLIGTDAGALWL